MCRDFHVRAAIHFVLVVAVVPEVGFAQSSIRIDAEELVESSGICLGNATPGRELLWSHNDSGDRPRLFALSRSGQLLATVDIVGASAADWEDVCSFHRGGKWYIAVADVGDNQGRRTSVVIYVIEEPSLQGVDGASVGRLAVPLAMAIPVRYPTGACDCEVLVNGKG